MTYLDHNQQEHREHRRRNLTEEDIEELLHAFESRLPHGHSCRFDTVTTEDFYESVKFFKTLNEGLTSGRNIIAKTVLVLLITFLFGMLGAGILSKLKTP